MSPAGPLGGPCLALDIGGTKVDAAVVTADGVILRREVIDVKAAGVRLFEELVDLVTRVRAGESVGRLGVACPGPMDRLRGRVSPLNIPVWRDFELPARLEDALGLSVRLEGDVRSLALAEGAFGAAIGVKNYASLVVSTGVGGALVLDGRLLDGASGNAGHLGHVTVVPDGRPCSCGSRGCLEAEASGWAIEEMTGEAPRLADAALRHRTADLVGRAVGTLAAVLDFTRCFVAGSVALGFAPEFFEVATSSARRVASIEYARDIAVVPSGLGSDGPVLGAACVAWRDS